jgi:hypothetical protein
MKIITSTSITAWIPLLSAVVVTAILGAVFQDGTAEGQQLLIPTAAISPRTKNFVSDRWNNTSFALGIAIIADASESPTSRAAAMEVLHANRKRLTTDEMRTFLGEATRLAKGVSLGEANSAFAVSVMANLALTMRDAGQLSEAESKQEAGFLVAMATDSRRNIQLRASSIAAARA